MFELSCVNKMKEKWRVDHEFAFFSSLSTGNKCMDRSSSRRHSNTGKGSVCQFHCAIHIFPHVVNGSNSENSPLISLNAFSFLNYQVDTNA